MYYRTAIRTDVPRIVNLLANDVLGRRREALRDPLPQAYFDAFEQIDADPNQELMVIINDKEDIIGTFQLTFIQYLTYKGGIRAQMEAIRVEEAYRGQGIGRKAFEWAIQRAKQRGAHLMQLTTDKGRPNALKFYEKLGFVASHDGLKLHFNK